LRKSFHTTDQGGRAMAKAAGKPSLTEMMVELKGFNHRAIASTRREIAAEVPLAVELRREPTNIHDGNAVAVHLLEKPWKELHIGYLPKGVAVVFAPKMDDGRISVEEAWLMEVDPEEGSGQLLLKVRKRKPNLA